MLSRLGAIVARRLAQVASQLALYIQQTKISFVNHSYIDTPPLHVQHPLTPMMHPRIKPFWCKWPNVKGEHLVPGLHNIG